MCETLAEVRAGLRRWTAELDAALLSAADAERVVEEAAAIEGVAAAIKALASARVAEGVGWRGGGERSAAHHLARVSGSSLSQAVEAIETGRRLEALPVVAAAARAGSLSAQQTAVLADAAAVDPAAEARLVEAARDSSLGELRRECARTKAAGLPDPETRRAEIHRRRYLRSYVDAEGAWNLRVRDNPEVGAHFMATLEPIRDRLFRAARKEGRREPVEAYAADALAELARGGRPAKRAGTKIIVRVDLPALVRGRPAEGELCEIAGFGPVAVSAVRELLESGDPFLAAVVTEGEKVTGVAHLGRRPNARQQTALEWLSPECSAVGCPNVSFLETDHRVDWAASTSPCSTCSTGSVGTTTSSRPGRAGPWSRAGASGSSSLPATLAIRATPTGHPTERNPGEGGIMAVWPRRRTTTPWRGR